MTKPTDKQVRREEERIGQLFKDETWRGQATVKLAEQILHLKSTIRALRKELKKCQVDLANMPTRIEH